MRQSISTSLFRVVLSSHWSSKLFVFQQVELQLLWSDFISIVSSTQEQFMLCSSPFLISTVQAEFVPPAWSGQSLNRREQVQRILWASCVVECGREKNNPFCPSGWDRNCLWRDSSFSHSCCSGVPLSLPDMWLQVRALMLRCLKLSLCFS